MREILASEFKMDKIVELEESGASDSELRPIKQI